MSDLLRAGDDWFGYIPEDSPHDQTSLEEARDRIVNVRWAQDPETRALHAEQLASAVLATAAAKMDASGEQWAGHLLRMWSTSISQHHLRRDDLRKPPSVRGLPDAR